MPLYQTHSFQWIIANVCQFYRFAARCCAKVVRLGHAAVYMCAASFDTGQVGKMRMSLNIALLFGILSPFAPC